MIKLYSHIKDNIFCINVELPDNPLRNLNAYLIKGEDRNLLIDTGFPEEPCYRALTAGLAELGVSMDNTDIFSTHLHSDHTGLVARLLGKDTKAYMSRVDCRYISYLSTREAFEDMVAEQKASGFPDNQLRKIPKAVHSDEYVAQYRDYIPLDDGAILSYGGRELRAIMTPGHTPGHMCLYDAKDKIMFLGDHVLFDITPNIVTWRGFHDSLGTYVNSLVDISGYEVELPLPAHRSVSGSMSERVGSIIEHHGRRVKELADLLDTYPGSTVYDLAGHMSWNIRFNGDWECFPLTQKFFAVGEMRAHIDYLVIRGRAIKERRGEVDYYYPAKYRSAQP